MNLANIHTIRKSFQSLRTLCSGPRDAIKYVFVFFIHFQCSSLHSHSHLICWIWSSSLLVYYGHIWYSTNLMMTQLFLLFRFNWIEPHIFKRHSLDFFFSSPLTSDLVSSSPSIHVTILRDFLLFFFVLLIFVIFFSLSFQLVVKFGENKLASSYFTVTKSY